MIFGVKPELEADDRAVDAFDGQGQDHVEDEELTFKSVGDIVSASSRVVHGTDIGQVFDALEVTSLRFVKPIEASLLDELPDDLKSDLITPLVDEGHAHIVDEDAKQLVLGRTVLFTHLVIAFLLD